MIRPWKVEMLPRAMKMQVLPSAVHRCLLQTPMHAAVTPSARAPGSPVCQQGGMECSHRKQPAKPDSPHVHCSVSLIGGSTDSFLADKDLWRVHYMLFKFKARRKVLHYENSHTFRCRKQMHGALFVWHNNVAFGVASSCSRCPTSEMMGR